MENIPSVHAEVDDTTSQTVQDCLCTTVILRQVLEQFSNSELLELSLVNKQWNFEARSVLRSRGNLVARIGTGETCQNLVAFASDLEQMRVVPFSGIKILLSHSNERQSPCKGLLDPSYNLILERLSWKQLDVTFTANWKNYRDCPAIALLQKILDGFGGVLEKLSLNIQQEVAEWLEKLVENRSFPHLKTLVLQADTCTDSFANFVKAFVACAPNLQELCFGENLNLKDNVLDESSAVLVPDFEFSPLHKKVCASLIGALRPEAIQIYSDDTADLELLNEFVPKVFHASRTSLKTLRMDLLFALPLMCYGICLENVTKLEIRVNGLMLLCLQPPMWKLLKGFDFTRVFPKLNQVRILNDTETDEHPGAFVHPLLNWFSPTAMNALVEQGNAVLKNTLPDRAINIKQLTLNESVWELHVNLWAKMFPHVKKLSVEADGTSLFPFPFLVESFGNLEELHVTCHQRRPSNIINLDCEFCGIYSAELCELKGKDDEYLKAVNIVPVGPSITCMRNLRSFTCRYIQDEYWGRSKDSTFMFSKVTALLGFARCPSLVVTLETNLDTAAALGHLEPYVTMMNVESLSSPVGGK